MDSFSTDSLLSFGHLTRFRDPSCNILPALQPALTRAPPSRPWHTGSDSEESSLFALVADANCSGVKFGHNQPFQGGSAKPLYTDPAREYPSPPSSSSTSQNTIPLPEEPGESASVYSTHLVGVLDSPPVMRRRDLASQRPLPPPRPLTPPPTIPHPTLKLPDADIDIPFVDEQLDEEEAEFEDEEHSFSPSGSSPPSVQSDLPLSPLSPSWDSSCTQVLSVASSQDLSDSEQPNALFSPCDVSPTPAYQPLFPSHEASSLLGVGASCPLFAPISFSWSPDPQYVIKQDPTSSMPIFSSFPSLTDSDDLLPPSSPRTPLRELPDVEDDRKPQIISSSDSNVDMVDCAGDSASAPGQKLVSLPGAETDDNLIPTIPAPAPAPDLPTPFPPLLVHDLHDVPPRPPSPEDFDFCLTSADMTDPELAKLFDLRKRSIAAERAAKLMEARPGEFDLFRLAEARKTQKRERDRSKEVGALIRLKLGDGKCPQTQIPERDQLRPRSRGAIGSVSQLVAQMVFRRSDGSRPFSKRKSVIAPRECVRSSLYRE